jgi:hypothetical protein
MSKSTILVPLVNLSYLTSQVSQISSVTIFICIVKYVERSHIDTHVKSSALSTHTIHMHCHLLVAFYDFKALGISSSFRIICFTPQASKMFHAIDAYHISAQLGRRGCVFTYPVGLVFQTSLQICTAVDLQLTVKLKCGQLGSWHPHSHLVQHVL